MQWERGGGAGEVEKWLWNDGTSKATLREKRDNSVYFWCQWHVAVAPGWCKQINLLLIKPQRLLLHSTPNPLCFLRLHLHDLPHLLRSRSLNRQAQTSERFFLFFFCFFKRSSVGSSTRDFYLESCRFKEKSLTSEHGALFTPGKKKEKSSRPFYVSPALIFLLLLF